MTLISTNKNYQLFFFASAVSNLVDGVSALALAWLASLITHDPMLIAFVTFATRLPWLLCAIPAGVMADRYDRKSLIVADELDRMIGGLCGERPATGCRGHCTCGDTYRVGLGVFARTG